MPIVVEQFYLISPSTLLVENSVLLLPHLHRFLKTLGLIYSNRFFDPGQGTLIRTIGIQALWEGSVPDPPIRCSGYVRCCGRHSLAPGKMVRSHHGAATVSGERLCIDATVIDVNRHS